MGKRIVLCFDGTWNTPDDHADLDGVAKRRAGGQAPAFEEVDERAGVETNVCRLYRSVKRVAAAEATGGRVEQVKWYDEGVGTKWHDRVAGGAFGLGLSRNIREGYKRLSDWYQDGDQVFVFGFSRGAYTARSLVGMIRNCGVLPQGSLPKPDADRNPLLMEAYELYRTRDEGADGARARAFRDRHRAPIIPIQLLGVWDTVGALGVPVESFEEFNSRQFEFHDTELSGTVQHAYQAIATDEHRKPYAVTMWDPKEKPNQTIEQRWFVGAHADVGGGYKDRRLSDLTLRWMQQKAMGCGLELDPAGIPAAEGAVEASFTDSFAGFLNGIFQLFQARYFRPVHGTKFGEEKVDETVRERLVRDLSYRPKNPGIRDPDEPPAAAPS